MTFHKHILSCVVIAKTNNLTVTKINKVGILDLTMKGAGLERGHKRKNVIIMEVKILDLIKQL